MSTLGEFQMLNIQSVSAYIMGNFLHLSLVKSQPSISSQVKLTST